MQFLFNLLTTTVLAHHNLADFKCPADRHAVALGCSSAQQCSPYTTDPVDCIRGACCTKSGNPIKLPYQAPLICSNGGRALVVGCIQSQQCLQFTKEPVACLQGICCTVPQKCPNSGRIVGLQCANSQSCVPLSGGRPVICIDGMCCTLCETIHKKLRAAWMCHFC
uniref:CC domain-containing protein n=1 Tax=Wuchereria bancrofti TaxID=6293 RepID=A0AAF5PQR1_WUCBA